jgi:hypothetical protein
MNSRCLAIWILLASAPAGAQSLDADSRPASSSAAAAKDHAGAANAEPVVDDGPQWGADVSLSNIFDGNIDHEQQAVQSYGFVPAGVVRFASSRDDPGMMVEYELASNTFSGSDTWDRISHALFAGFERRVGKRITLETEVEATWKGSSEDRELANVYSVAPRLSYRITRPLRVSVLGAYRYKSYADDPGTTGPSPYIGTKLDVRLPRDRRIGGGYRYELRMSREPRDRYRRSVWSLEFSTPVASRVDRLEIEGRVKNQIYDRLIKVDGVRVPRHDVRFALDVMYRRPLSATMDAVWVLELDSRTSNDPDKPYRAPMFGFTVVYHWR